MWYCEYEDLVIGEIHTENSIIYAKTEEELKQIVGLSGITYIVKWGYKE